MENNVNQCDNEVDPIFIIKPETEVEFEIEESGVNWTTENGSTEIVENCEDSIEEVNKSWHHGSRSRIRNRSDEDIVIISAEELEYTEQKSNEDFLLQEPSSSTSAKKLTANISNINKIKQSQVNDSLKQVLTEIGLYHELYEFMKSRGITADALKYMKTRHIDELFKGTRLNTKIIFEHNLKEWQNKNGICEVTTTESKYSESNVQGIRIKNNDDVDSTKNLFNLPQLGKTDMSGLTMRLVNAVQQAINTILQEYTSCQQQSTDKHSNYGMAFNNEMPIDVVTTDKIKTEPNVTEETILPDKIYRKISRKSYKTSKPFNDLSLLNQTDEYIIPQPKRKKVDLDINVQEILIMFPFGQRFIDEYQNTGFLTPSQRTELVRTIIDFYVRNNQVITVSRCREIAEEIVALFPTECLETYFIQENKTKPPKGRIWDRYQGRKRSLRKFVSLDTSQETFKTDPLNDSNEIPAKVDWSEMETMCSKMKHIKNEVELLTKWKESFAFRRHQLQTDFFSNWKLYFDEYPFCKQQNYTQYIESDLNTLYPNLKFNDYLWTELMQNFQKIFLNRIKHHKSKYIFDQLVSTKRLDVTSDYVAIKVVALLHAVLKTNSKQLQSMEDAQRNFTVEVTDLSDLKKVVIERKKHFTDNNLPAKPYIAVVGQNKSYSHFSVILDSTGFSCDSYRDALVLCFNLYLFFDISFPHESLNVWTFIQKYLFNKSTFVSNPTVESFINDIYRNK